MRSSKIYDILSQFSKIEQNRLRKFVLSPYFNANETLSRLYELIINEVNQPSSREWSREEVWNTLLPGEAYDDVRMRKYFSDLLKLVEAYLAQQVYESDRIRQNIYLLDAVYQRRFNRLYNSSLRNGRELFEKSPIQSSDYYYGKFMLEVQYYNLAEFEQKRTLKSNWEEISRNLDYFYIAEKLKIYCNVLSRRTLSTYEYELQFMDEVLEHIEKKNLTEIPPIATYYQVVKLYQYPEDEQHYQGLKQLLDRYAMVFPKDEASDLYSLAQNYCIRQINRGNSRFLSELFILYQDVLERRIIFKDDKLSPWDFRNIVVVGLRAGDYKWVQEFIEKYQWYLPEEKRENARSFNMAQLYFYQKKYDEVISLLRFVEYDDLTYNLNSKDMLLRVYYDTSELEPLYSLFESFRAYLNRSKDIPERSKQAYKNLIRFTKKLTRLFKGDAKGLEKLKTEIQATNNVANQKWLLEKVEELAE